MVFQRPLISARPYIPCSEEPSQKVLPAFEQVFATGRPLLNVEVTAKVPSRVAPVRWSRSFLPIKNESGHVEHVAGIVLELTRLRELDSAFLRLTGKLTRIISVWRHDLSEGDGPDVDRDSPRLAAVFAESVALLESCVSETRAIASLLHTPPQVAPIQPICADAGRPAGQAQDLVRAGVAESVDPLSAREREIAALLADGKSNKQIGSMLTISTRTVESHRARIMLKLDLHSVTDLVRYAVRSNLIQP